jgi:chromosome segregation ATPase
MSNTQVTPEVSDLNAAPRDYSRLLVIGLVAAVVLALAGLVWSYSLAGRLTHAEAQVASAQAQNEKLEAALTETNARLRVTSETLGQRLGLTEQQLQSRANDLLKRQQADAKQFETEQQAQQKQLTSVSTDLTATKTDVGGVKTDLTATKTQLQNDEAAMQSMKGDMGLQSGLIATNSKEIDILKHMGDRNIYEFTLQKGRKQAVATVALELKKADEKHSKFTLSVYADDKEIPKKDRSLDEPIQFYTGKDHLLYELVVNNISKNQIQGYIATPKNAPVPVTPTPNGD